YRKTHLTFVRDSQKCQLSRQRPFIYILRHPRLNESMHFNRSADHLLGQPLSFLIDSGVSPLSKFKYIHYPISLSSFALSSRLRAQFRERPEIRAGDAAVGDVADDGDLEAFHFAESLANGIHVEQALRGMFVSAVAGVHDAALHRARKQFRGAGGGMADHNHI